MKQVEIKHIIYVIIALTVVGLALYALNRAGHISIPSSIQIGKSGPLLASLVVLYFILGFAILYLFFKPKTVGETLAVAGASILWNIY